jgi:uncharacterized membrane protein
MSIVAPKPTPTVMPSPVKGLASARVESLSDGVFSIAMTLLVLDLRVPEPAGISSPAQLLAGLTALWPSAVGYLLSFVTAGSLWIAHRGQFHYIRRTDRKLLWVNIAFLGFVSAIPFFTALMAHHPSYRLPIVLYGANMICALLALFVHWRHATRGHRLTTTDLTDEVIAAQARRILIGPVIYLTAIAIAIWWNLWICLAVYALVPVVFALPSSLDRHWHQRHYE